MHGVVMLLVIFIVSFVAGVGWYAGRKTVELVAGAVSRRGATAPAKRVQPAAAEVRMHRQFFE